MKAVELRSEVRESKFPIMNKKELCRYDEYFLVSKDDEENPNIYLLRYIDDVRSWYFIRLDAPYTNKMELDMKELFDRFYIYCIPEYTGGCCDSAGDDEESKKSRIELLEFLINEYMKRS